MAKTRQWVHALTAIAYGLWQIATEVDGYNSDLARNCEAFLRSGLRENKINASARYMQDRFARVCQDLRLFDQEDIQELREAVFDMDTWYDWNKPGS